MEHSEAIETNASDRYVLGDLSAAEADAFEEHYFDCTACAEDVRLGMSIMDGGRRLVRETNAAPEPAMAPVIPIESRPRKRFRWIPAAAAAAILALVGNIGMLMRMQSVPPRVVQVAAELKPEDALRTSDYLDLSVRAGEPLVVTDTFSYNIVSETPYETYKVQILDAAGKVVSERQHPSELVTAKPLSVDARVLAPGSYQLVIFGIGPAGQSTETARGGFVVKRETQRGQLQQRGPRRERWNSHTTQAPVLQAA